MGRNFGRLMTYRLNVLSTRAARLCLSVGLLSGFFVLPSFAATLSGTFSGVSADFSTSVGVPIAGSFMLDPQSGSGTSSVGPGHLYYAPLPNSVFLTFSSSLGDVSFSNKTSDAEILLGTSSVGDQSLILEINDTASGFAATLNLGSLNKELFGDAVPPYTNSSFMTGYAEYVGGGVDEGLNLTSLIVSGPLTTPVPPMPLTAVPLSPSWLMMTISLAVLITSTILKRARPKRAFLPA